MPTEKFSNTATSTLNASIGSGDTTLVLVSAALFPATPQFRINVEGELMLVTGVAGGTLTVTRGIEGSTASAHLAGAPVVQIVTAGAITSALAGSISRTNDTNLDITETSGIVGVWFRGISAPRTGKLPASPTDGMIVEIVDEDGSLTAAHTWTIDGNGKNIVNKSAAAATLTLNNVTGGAFVVARLRFSTAANVWKASLA